MNRGGRSDAAAVADSQGVAKSMLTVRSWVSLDCTGRSTVLDVDKHVIMRRAQIHARDLRIIDPLLSYPSTILGRERAIVLNLEHIKAIITAEEVLLRDPSEENVIPVLEELHHRLPANSAHHAEREATDHYRVAEVDVPQFEFRALEVALEAICHWLDARTIELEASAYPALDELTCKVRYEIEQLLEDDNDMANLYLSRKMSRWPQSLHVWMTPKRRTHLF